MKFSTLLGAFLGTLPLAVASLAQPAFPDATPESVGMTRASLEALDKAVQGFIDRREAVGAELLIIKNRRTVWHASHGLKDSVTKAPMENGGIFCVRSQTKPLVGTAVQMLLDEGKISLSDRASKYLPEFDTDSHRAITIQNLLEHRSGLPLSSLLTVDHKTLKGVEDIVALTAKATLEFEPGTGFNYSDDGTDSLAAIVQRVSGMPAAEFVRTRIIEPLGMRDTMCASKKDDPSYARINSNHSGTTGTWSRYWSPEEDPLFPYFLGSQSLYSTCEDYARFLCLWADGGVVGAGVGGTRLLSEAAITRGLNPVSAIGFPTGFDGLEVWYAQLWQTWVKPGTPPERVAFGHSGSDGTCAWMWPERDLIVLYFTQSRGGLSGLSIENEIDRLLIRGEDPAKPGATANLAGLEGVYWDAEGNRSWAVIGAGAKLHLEMQGKTAMDLVASGDGGWKFELEPATRVTFDKTPGGAATRMTVTSGIVSRTLERLSPAPDLPSAEKVESMVQAAHRLGRFPGVIRREGTLKLPAVGIDSPYVELIAGDRSFTEFNARGTRTRVLVRDGTVRARMGDKPSEQLDGPRAAQSLFQRTQVIFGGWTDAGARVSVLKRVQEDGKPALLVRLVPRDGNACVLYVDEASGRVVRADQLVAIAGMGTVGLTTRWGEFEDIGVAVLPRSAKSEYVTPMLGKGETRFETQSVVEGGDGPFEIDRD